MFSRNIRSVLFAGLNSSSYRQARTSTANQIKKPLCILSPSELESILLNRPVKPTFPMNGYAMFVAEYSKKLRTDNSELAGSEVWKLCAEKWNSMSKDEKKHFADLAASDKCSKQESIDEYHSSMNSLVKVKDIIVALHNLTSAAKEERRNLRKMGSLNLFMKSENNDHLSLTEMAKRWGELDDEKKAEYKAAVEKSNKEVNNDLKKWRQKWKIIAVS